MNEKYKSIIMITKIRNNMSFKYIMQSKGLKGLNTFLFFRCAIENEYGYIFYELIADSFVK